MDSGKLFWSWKHSSKQNKFPNLLEVNSSEENRPPPQKKRVNNNTTSRSYEYTEGMDMKYVW